MPKKSGPKIYWTRRRILEAARAWHTEHGQPPNSSDWEHGKNLVHPSREMITKRFGSWEGFRVIYEKSRFQRPQWDREQVISEFQKWAEREGVPPTAKEWEKDHRYPSPYHVGKLFGGGWREATEAAGFYPRSRGLTKKALARYTPMPRRSDSHAVQGP